MTQKYCYKNYNHANELTLDRWGVRVWLNNSLNILHSGLCLWAYDEPNACKNPKLLYDSLAITLKTYLSV